MGFFQKLKKAWQKFTGGGGSKSTARRSAPTTRTVASRKDGGGGYYSGGRSVRRDDDEEKKRREKLKSVYKAPAVTQTKNVIETAKKNDEKLKADIKSKAENRKKLIADRKAFNEATRQQSFNKAVKTGTEKQKLALEAQKKRQQELSDWHKATGNRYNVNEKGISKEEKKRRQQNVKSQVFDPKTAVAEAEHSMKYHKKAESFGRGALSGVTFGASDLIAKKGLKGEAKKAEEVYQKNKSKGAEAVGEVAGSLAAFGLTSGASKAVVKKALPKAVKGTMEKGGAKLTAKLAGNKLIKKAAEKEVANAVKKGLAKEVSKEAVERVAKSKAKELVANLAEDAAINVTTGAIMDVNKAATTAKNKKDFAKEMGKSAAANIALGTGATVGLPAAGKALKRAVGGVTEGSETAIKSLVKNASKDADEVAEKAVKDVKVSLNRRNRASAGLKRDIRTVDTDAPLNAETRRTLQNYKKTLEERLEEVKRSGGNSEKKAKEVASLEDDIRRAEKMLGENNDFNARIRNIESDYPAEEWLGQYGHITNNKDGTYNLFVNGEGDRTLNRKEMETYVQKATDRLKADEERVRVTRTSPLTDLETARVNEIDDEIARLETEGRADAEKSGAKNKYKGIEGYWDRQGERGQRITELTQERNRILNKEPEGDILRADNGSIDDEIERLAKEGGEGTSITAGESRPKVNEPIREVRKPAEVMQGYSSVGSKKKISETSKRVQSMLDDGDVSGAKEEVRRIVDDIVSKTKVVQDLDDTRKEIKEVLKNTRIRIPEREKFTQGYLAGGYNELRKQNFGSLNITKDGVDVDDLWLSLRERYGNLFPDDIDNTADQLQYLINLTKAKGVGYEIAEDEADYLRRELADSIWEQANAGREHTPFDVDEDQLLTEALSDRPFEAEELADFERRMEAGDLEDVDALIENERRNNIVERVNRATTETEAPRASEADSLVPYATDETAEMPVDDIAQTRINDKRAEIEERANLMAEEPPRQENGDIKVNGKSEDVNDALPSGVRQVRDTYNVTNADQLVEGGRRTSWDEAWDASRDYSKSHAKGEKTRQSKVAVTQLNAMDSEAERELRSKLVESGDLNYETVSSQELYDKVAKEMRDDAHSWVSQMIDINEGGALDFRSTPEWQARVQYILGTVDPSADKASEIAYTEAFKLAQNISSKGGQTLNLRRNFVHLTPVGKRDAILDDLVNILQKNRKFRGQHRAELAGKGVFDQRNYIRGYLMENKKLSEAIENVVKAKNVDDVGDNFTELIYEFNKSNPKNMLDVVQELRYLNMLGNPKTHIRNVFGSAFFSPIRQTSNAIRSAIEQPIAKRANLEKEITRHGGFSIEAIKEASVKNPTSEAGKAAKEAEARLKADILGTAKYDQPTYKGRGKTIAGKTIDFLSDFNSKLLSKEDDFFRSRAFKENYIKSYNRYLKDGKPITDKIKRKIEQEAIQEAQIATFNEYNGFAKWLNSIVKNANDANASYGQRAAGLGVNAIMPFTKVPANLAKQSINYSPLGIARGFANIRQAASNADAEALNQAIDQLASGLTGTGIFGLGMLLGKTTDLFTTNAGKDSPDAKFKKNLGMQNYAINFKDPDTGKGYSFTLDWLVPTSATFFAGVEAANQWSKGDMDLLSIGGDWSTVMSRLAEPVLETSMLSGLHGMLETMRGGYGGDDDKGALDILMRETVQSYLNSMIPTLAGQISRTAYKTDMQIAGDTDWEYWRNTIKSKAGLANTNILGEALGADTDVFGNVKGADESKAYKILKNFISPANIQKIDFSKVDEDKLAEYERRVKAGEDPETLAYLFPKKQYKKTFKLKDEQIQMSNKELSAYNQAKTKGGAEGMRYLLENIMFNRYELDDKGKKVPTADAYTKAEKAKLMAQFKGKSMREVEEWLYAQPEFQNATDAERKKAINGLWTLSGQGKANASQRVGEQAVWKAQGKDVNEYNFKNEVSEKKIENLTPYIEAGVLTYEEAVDFARNAGKTYYYENEDGGSSQTYYNKKQMIEYLVKKGYSYKKAEALFNSFKASNAKDYNGNSLSSGRKRRGYRRRGYRRYGGGGGGGTGVKIKTSAYKPKASDLKMKEVISTKDTGKKAVPKKKTTTKKTPPTPKLKKYEV